MSKLTPLGISNKKPCVSLNVLHRLVPRFARFITVRILCVPPCNSITTAISVVVVAMESGRYSKNHRVRLSCRIDFSTNSAVCTTNGCNNNNNNNNNHIHRTNSCRLKIYGLKYMIWVRTRYESILFHGCTNSSLPTASTSNGTKTEPVVGTGTLSQLEYR